jgi:hypothetical protein
MSVWICRCLDMSMSGYVDKSSSCTTSRQMICLFHHRQVSPKAGITKGSITKGRSHLSLITARHHHSQASPKAAPAPCVALCITLCNQAAPGVRSGWLQVRGRGKARGGKIRGRVLHDAGGAVYSLKRHSGIVFFGYAGLRVGFRLIHVLSCTSFSGYGYRPAGKHRCTVVYCRELGFPSSSG